VLTLGRIGPNVTLVILTRSEPASLPNTDFDNPLRAVLHEWMPIDEDDEEQRQRARRLVQSSQPGAGAPVAGTPVSCTASSPASLSCD